MMHPRILLINPYQATRYPQPPLGLAMVAAVLEKGGYPTKILDLSAIGLPETSIRAILCREKPDVVGITAMTPTIDSAIRAARAVKEADRDVFVALGGAHATLLPEETLNIAPEVDAIILGEGEQTTLELIGALESDPGRIDHVPGIASRENDCIKRCTSRAPISDLDTLPFPAFHLLPMMEYRLHPPFGRRPPAMPIITSRGCPYRCIYCSKAVFGNRYRSNSPTYVTNEILFLKEKFGMKEVKFYDDVFTLDRKRILELCSQLRKNKIDIPWTCETRVNLIDDQLLRAMKSAGCYMIEYGVESGNQTILNSLKKDVSLVNIVDAFRSTHEAGIETVAYFMLGSPKDTPETIHETIEFAKRINPDFAQFSITTPYPGTELFELALKDGNMSDKWEDYTYADLESVSRHGYGAKTMSRDQLRLLNRKAYETFYLRWRYIKNRLRKMTSFDSVKTNLAGLRMVVELIR